MFLSKKSVLTLGFVLAGLLLQSIPSYGQNFGWARQFGGTDTDVAYDVTTDAAGNVYVTGYFNGVVDFDPGAGVANLTSGGGDDIFIVKLDSAGSLIWARRIGGPSDARAWNVIADANGNVYTTGWFEGTADFDPGVGVANLTVVGSYNAFVSKLDSSGNFVWARLIGGAGYSEGDGIGVDGAGNVYTTGYFNGSGDFDPGAGVFTMNAVGGDYTYISKLDSSGNFVWARQFVGSNYSYPVGLTLDANSNVHLVGSFAGTVDFNPGAGTATLTSAGEEDIFVAKLNGSGNYLWARRFGSDAYDYGYDIAVDGNGDVVTTGSFFGTVDFNPGPGTFNLNSAGSDDGFISKLDSAGNFVWARRLGGSDFDFSSDVAFDGDGNIYTAGLFSQTADFDPGAGVFNLIAVGGDEIFASKLDSGGNFVWARAMGGAGDEFGEGIAVRGGNVYVAGRFTGTADMDPSGGVANLASLGDRDAFVVNLTSGTGGLPPMISSGGIVMANLLPTVNTVSPLSIISVFGENFTTETILYPTLDPNGRISTILGGTCLLMNGEPLPIFAITPGQINAQASASNAFGPASFTVETNCATIAAVSSAARMMEFPAPRALTSGVEMATVEAATPSFFIFDPVAANGFIAARFNATAEQTAAAVAPTGMFNDQFGPSRPAKPGDIVLLYGTGWGETTAGLTTGQLATVGGEVLDPDRKLTLGGIQLSDEDLIYVGVTPQTAGLYQAAIRIPANTTPGNKQVVLTVYGKSTPVGPVIPIGAP